jgi:hypothetical protein
MTIKCFLVKLLTLYSNRILYGVKCNLDSLYKDIVLANRLAIIEDNIQNCNLSGDIIDEITNFKRKLVSHYNFPCANC